MLNLILKFWAWATLLKLRVTSRNVARSLGPPPQPGSVLPAPKKGVPQFEPGDFAEKNSHFIALYDGMKGCGQLWDCEAKEAEMMGNPTRANEARACAAAAVALRESTRRFYSRWQILD